MTSIDKLRAYTAIPGCIFLFILPFAHTVALRLICLFALAAMVTYLWRHDPPPSLPFKLPMASWAAVCWLSLAWSIEPSYSLGELVNEVGYSILTFFTFFYLTQTDVEWRRWRYAIIASFVAISVYAISNYLAYDDWVTTTRVGDRNTFSTFVVLVTPFLLLTISQPEISATGRVLAWLGLPIAAIGGYCTGNRIMWPALMVATLVFYLLHFRKLPVRGKRRAARIVGLGAVSVILLALFLSVASFRTGAPGAGLSEVETALAHNPRPQIWSYAKERILERPLSGYGYGRGILRQDFTTRFGNERIWHAHNGALNYVIEVGPFGLAALLWLTVAIGLEFWRTYGSDDRRSWQIGAFGLSLMAGLLIKTMTDDILVRDNALLFWASVGMTLGLARGVLRDPDSSGRPTR